MTSRTSPSHRDRGFTLVEVLIVVGLIGLLAAAMSAAIIVFLRNDDSVVSRLTNSQDLSNIENYLPGDVASANVIEDGVAVPFSGQLTDADCRDNVGAVPTAWQSNSLVRLGWDQKWRDGSAAEYEVIYAYDATAGEIVRHECVNDSHSSVVVARRFTGTPSVNLPDLDPGPIDDFGTVELILQYSDGPRRLAASSRNYNPNS